MSETKVIESWDDMLAVDDTEYMAVEIGEGRYIRLGSLSAAEMINWLTDQQDEEKSKTNGLVLVAKCMVNSRGLRIGKLDKIIELRKKQPKTVKKLIRAATKLNELEVKEETKNDSDGIIPSVSSTDSASQPVE